MVSASYDWHERCPVACRHGDVGDVGNGGRSVMEGVAAFAILLAAIVIYLVWREDDGDTDSP